MVGVFSWNRTGWSEFFRLAVGSLPTARSTSANESEGPVYIFRFLDPGARHPSAGARAGGTRVSNHQDLQESDPNARLRDRTISAGGERTLAGSGSRIYLRAGTDRRTNAEILRSFQRKIAHR